MAKKISWFFPTYVFRDSLPSVTKLNADLEKAIFHLRETDRTGQKWSAEGYRNGYTSFPNNMNLNETHPVFRRLCRLLLPRAKEFIEHLNWAINPRKITMLSCWANAMGEGSHHGLHNHSLSMLSGVYYINSPKGGAPFIIEDPRIDCFMGTPNRRETAPRRDQPRVEIFPKAGEFILFESWLRHEVPLHTSKEPRLSVAFNLGVPLQR